MGWPWGFSGRIVFFWKELRECRLALHPCNAMRTWSGTAAKDLAFLAISSRETRGGRGGGVGPIGDGGLAGGGGTGEVVVWYSAGWTRRSFPFERNGGGHGRRLVSGTGKRNKPGIEEQQE